MWIWVALLASGFFAELVDGSLGMGFGVTNASFLISIGLTPVAASAGVHTAEIATSLASGASHFRLGNVDRRSLLWLAVPGCVGGVVGAVALSNIDPAGSRPLVALFLAFMGALIVWRALRRRERRAREFSASRTSGVGFVAATLDAFGGGGWGPVATPSLILQGSVDPRKAVGTVNLAEFFVTCAITATFFLLLGFAGIPWEYVAAVAIGGVAAAPIAALLVHKIPTRSLGEIVGALLIVLNGRVLAVDVGGVPRDIAAPITLIALLGIATWFAMALRGGWGTLEEPPEPRSPEVV